MSDSKSANRIASNAILAILSTILLICVLQLVSNNSIAYADEADIELADNTNIVECNDIDIWINPEYEFCTTEQDILDELAKQPQTYTHYGVDDPYTIDELGVVIRDAFVEREGTIDADFICETNTFDIKTIEDKIYEHTGNPKEGDYLLNATRGITSRKQSESINSDGTYTLTYRFQAYYMGFADSNIAKRCENEVDERIDEIINELNISSTASEYEKITTIYNWIVSNVSYSTSASSVYNLRQHTAWAGLCYDGCVCQGFATICYRLFLEEGIDCRLIYGSKISHVWNIVKLDDIYYNIDSTWDAGRSYPYKYFLICESDFSERHPRNEEYTTDEWNAAYPMASKSYQPVSQKFDDVSAGAWYTGAVQWAYNENIMTGYGSSFTMFGVGDSITRADLVTILWRYLESDAYTTYNEATFVNTTGLPDVEGGTYWTGAADWAVSEGIVTGEQLADGSFEFAPYDPVTFDQLVTVLARYNLGFEEAGAYPTSALSDPRFIDGDTVEDWAAGAMSWAIDNDIVTGNDNSDGTYTLTPLEDVVRERAATVLYRCARDELI